MYYRRSRRLFAGFVPTVVLTFGCSHKPPDAHRSLPKVTAARPVVRADVTDYEWFTARTEAVNSVDVRSQVTGKIQTIYFTPGAEVAKKQKLMTIDPSRYAADLDKAKKQIEQQTARVTRLDQEVRNLEKSGAAAALQEKIQKGLELEEAKAAVRSAESTARRVEIDLNDTEILAPIAGRISRPLVDTGNLIDPTIVLTSIVQLDPIYVYFDVSDRTRARYLKMVKNKEINRKPEDIAVAMTLVDGEQYAHPGKIDFTDTRIDKGTGTVTLRVVFDNKERQLVPGMFVRVRLPLTDPYEAVLVPERAVGNDQGQKFVFVLDGDKAKYVKVEVGALQPDGMLVLKSGVTRGQWVIVDGVQNVRADAEVEAEKVEATAPEGK